MSNVKSYDLFNEDQPLVESIRSHRECRGKQSDNDSKQKVKKQRELRQQRRARGK